VLKLIGQSDLRVIKEGEKTKKGFGNLPNPLAFWLRGKDLNLRPSGYEEDDFSAYGNKRNVFNMYVSHVSQVYQYSRGSFRGSFFPGPCY
jgi:hypothetical protein